MLKSTWQTCKKWGFIDANEGKRRSSRSTEACESAEGSQHPHLHSCQRVQPLTQRSALRPSLQPSLLATGRAIRDVRRQQRVIDAHALERRRGSSCCSRWQAAEHHTRSAPTRCKSPVPPQCCAQETLGGTAAPPWLLSLHGEVGGDEHRRRCISRLVRPGRASSVCCMSHQTIPTAPGPFSEFLARGRGQGSR